MDYCYVYKITCKTNSKIYIGISNNPKRRFREHIRRAYNKNSKYYNAYLPRAIRKYGEEDFSLDTILMGSREYCAEMEVKLINKFDSFRNGFNGSKGGEGSAYSQPWNKGVQGVCKANKTSFKKGNTPPTLKLTRTQIEKLVNSFKEGTEVKDMGWLPITKGQAYRVLKREGVVVTKGNRHYKSLGMLKLYKSGMLQVDIAKIYNLSPKVVSYYLNKTEGYKRTEGGMSNLT